jgi:LmbE family N-acetylglucosaminyl deacetylase
LYGVAVPDSPLSTTEAVGAARRVLAIYAHPDDPEVSCAGTLARWADEGAEVHLVICARGDKGRTAAGADPATLVARRADEAAAAAVILGLAGHENLGYPDGEVDNTLELRAELVERIRRFRPETVVSCDPTAVFFGNRYINHHDHRGVGFAVLDACAPAAASPLYFPDAGPAHQVGTIYLSGTLEPDTWEDISATVDRKVEALRCHRSQVGDDLELVGEVVRRRAASAGGDAGLAHAESFRVLRFR